MTNGISASPCQGWSLRPVTPVSSTASRAAESREPRRGLVVPARLQPAADGDVVDQQDLAVVGRDDKRTGGDVTRERRAVVERVTGRDLPAQQREPLARLRYLSAIALDRIGERLRKGRHHRPALTCRASTARCRAARPRGR